MTDIFEAKPKRAKVDTAAAVKITEVDLNAARDALYTAREVLKAKRAASALAISGWVRANPPTTINSIVKDIGARRAEQILAEKEAGSYTPRPGLTEALMRLGKPGKRKLPSQR